MALSWTMDKIGPIARSVEDCALVLSAIAGPDGHDLSVKPAAFNWDAGFDWRTLRVGYLKMEFDVPRSPAKIETPIEDPYRQGSHRLQRPQAACAGELSPRPLRRSLTSPLRSRRSARWALR